MVGMVATSWGDSPPMIVRQGRSPSVIASKLEQLRQLKDSLLHCDPSLLPDLLPGLDDLRSEPASPVRRAVAEMIGEMGARHMEFLHELIPILISFLNDETPAVVRQAITTGTYLFQNVLVKVATQWDDFLTSAWESMLKFKDEVFPIAFQHASAGVRLLAVKFIETVILLYTPDPGASPPHDIGDGFDISWLKGVHAVLNRGDLAMEASKSLGLLLDQLRLPHVKSLSNSIIIVLINSLSAIAKKRPSFYGRILPVLLSLDPASSIIKGVQVPGAHHALKSAFMACLECTHSSAAPWRPRLIEALKSMDAGDLDDQVFNSVSGDFAAPVEDTSAAKDDKELSQALNDSNADNGRKRHVADEDNGELQEDASPGKRLRQSLLLKEEIDSKPYQESSDSVHNNLSANNDVPRSGDGPVQQLVSMFGALVAQGDKAAQPLEILISSISSDLLAEVVMANMRNLPLVCPKVENEEELADALESATTNPMNMQSSGLSSGNYLLSSAYPLITSLLNVHPSLSEDNIKFDHPDEQKVAATVDAVLSSSDVTGTIARKSESTSIQHPVGPDLLGTDNAGSAVTFSTGMDTEEGKIPGLDYTNSFDEIQEQLDASSAELQRTDLEKVVSSGSTTPLETSSSGMSTYVSDTPSSRVLPDVQGHNNSTLAVPTQFVLPRMIVPDVKLTDEQKDHLQKEAFVRILECYKQVAASAMSDIHFPLLSNLGVEFPLEMDCWELLQKHILSDYQTHEGHELTLHVLYRLYRESEQDQDFLSSRTATSIYDAFLLTVAETLRDTFPASDKSLVRLLAEVPYLPEGVLKLLECLCCSGSNQKNDKDSQSGDRVTQGLSIVWNLILLRPSNRDRCLQIALNSTLHQSEEVRMKAIRLVANKLFPMSSISQKIQDFASTNLRVVAETMQTGDMDVDAMSLDSQKSLQNADMEKSSVGGETTASPSDNELAFAKPIPSSSVSEAQRSMSLYFALCTKKHSLLKEIFSVYERLPKVAKEAVHRHIPILVRTIGTSSDLLAIISDPPTGSNSLVMQVIQTLTSGMIPSQELISSVRTLYNSRMKDAEILFPILSFLPKEEILQLLPQLVSLPLDKFQDALTRIQQGSPQSGPCLTPGEVLIAIHGIDPEKDNVPLKKIMDACSACFDQRQFYTQQVLAKVLNQLVEQIPLPLLFMRTVIQSIGVFPALVDFVMDILSRLVNKQIWKYPKLWVGFLKCCMQTRPQSFNVLLQLPAAQLENALNRNPILKPPLAEHANQPSIKSTLPRSTLVVLGLVQEMQSSEQAQTSQSQAVDTGSTPADVATEVTQESSVQS